jgi:hypothetical protein
MSVSTIDHLEDQLVAFCQRWQVKELALFGSVLRDDFAPDSDIDVLVEFAGSYTLEMLLDMQDELAALIYMTYCGRLRRSSNLPLA